MSEKATFWINSYRVQPEHAPLNIIVSEQQVTKDDNENITSIKKLNFIQDPKRSFYYTLPPFRTHKYKKEMEQIEKLKKYEINESKLINTVFNVSKNLDMTTISHRKLYSKKIFNDPYIYGADLDVEVLIKKFYSDRVKNTKLLPSIDKGSLDIEVDLDVGCIPLMTYIHDKKVHTIFLEPYFYKTEGDLKIKASSEDIKQTVLTMLEPYTKDHNFEINFHMVKTEKELLEKFIKIMHYFKTDFVMIWNMPFDIPYIVERMIVNGMNPNMLCHPDVPNQYKNYNYYVDRSNVDHFTKTWDWVDIPGYTQFIDSMRLYSRLRTVLQKEPSYTLEAISSKILGKTKIQLDNDGEIDNHRYMLNNKFLEYMAYNIVDCILLILMEEVTNDIDSFMQQVTSSLYRNFANQTVMLKNDLYFQFLEMGKVVATAGSEMTLDLDKLLPRIGGTVLNPNLTKDMGLKILKERPDFETSVMLTVNDIDMTALYPSIIKGFNISKETKLFTAVKIDGHHLSAIEDYFGNIHSVHENCVYLGKTFYGLPSFKEMAELFKK